MAWLKCYSADTKVLYGSGAPLRSACGAKLTVLRPTFPLSLRPAMLSAAGPMLRGAASTQDAAAVATLAAQAIGGVAVAGEMVSAASRSCSRRRAKSQDSRVGEHLSILSNVDTPKNQNKTTGSTNRWQWMVELEYMRKKWQDVVKEK